MLDHSAGLGEHHGPGRHIACYDRTDTDYSSLSYCQSSACRTQDEGMRPDHGFPTDTYACVHALFLIGIGCDRHVLPDLNTISEHRRRVDNHAEPLLEEEDLTFQASLGLEQRAETEEDEGLEQACGMPVAVSIAPHAHLP
jgi:hypothetical protein